MDYIDRITSLREDNDYKQKDIAEILGIKQSAYSKYEKRRTKNYITYRQIIYSALLMNRSLYPKSKIYFLQIVH